MNVIKRFFQEDIPAVFYAGKWRVSLIQLKSHLTQLEKQKNNSLIELGNKAWGSRVKDERYGAVYGKLEELDVLLGQSQNEIDIKQAEVNKETENLNSARTDIGTRIKSTQDQRQIAMQKLSQLQSTQKGVELRINQLQMVVHQGTTNIQNMQVQIDQLIAGNQPDKDEKISSLQNTIATVQARVDETTPQIQSAKAELETIQSEQTPIKSEVDGYNQLINMLQAQINSTSSTSQEKTKRLQQDFLKANEKKGGFLNQIAALIPDLGNQVYRHRPISDALSEGYGKVDAVQNEIKAVHDQINITQARLASINSRSYQKVALAGGAIAVVALCITAFTAIVVPTISKILKPDPKKDIRLVQSWTLENCSINSSNENYSDISVWENRRSNAVANVEIDLKLLGTDDIVLDSTSSDLVIAPDGYAVSFGELDSKGSRVQEVTRSVSSVQFDETSIIQLRNVDVETFFEMTKDSNNITLSLEITNGSDFALEPTDVAYAFVINKQNKIIDILIGDLEFNSISVDSLSKITFQSLNYYYSASCLQRDYSDEKITFWYFVPLEIATNSNDRFTISGKVEYLP